MKLIGSMLFSFVLSLPAVAQVDGWKNNELAITYHYNSQLQYDWALRTLQHIDLHKTSKILDFGSGDGKITAALSLLSNAEVRGYDISKSMVTLARSLYPIDNHAQLSFHPITEINELPDDESFDLVTSFCVFHLVDKPTETLSHLSKSLKKGGKILLTIPAGGNKEFFTAVDRAFKKYSIQPPWTNKIQSSNDVNVRDINKLKEIAVESGLIPLKAEVFRNKNRFINKQSLTNWFIGTLTANWDIKDDIRNEFFSDLTDFFLESSPEVIDSTGAIRFELNRIDFLASKK
ncbi:MAG: class I SAM-dependent methyltransferase [Oligoflexales bacterium]